MKKTKLHVRLYADSLGLPRPELNIKNEDRYIHIISQHLEKKYETYPEILDRAKGDMSIKEINSLYDSDCRYFGNDIDILIIHNGIVDCAPRPIPILFRKIIAHLPQLFQKPIIRFLHNNRTFLMKLGLRFYVTSSNSYYNTYKHLLEKASTISKKIYLINIAPTNEKIEKHSPGLTKSINNYNSIIKRIIKELNKENVVLIDINSLILSSEVVIDEFVNPVDGHHITKKTHSILANMIEEHEDI